MKIGNIVVAKKDAGLLGEVIAIDSFGKVTIKLSTGIEIVADSCEFVDTGSNQPQRESGKIVHILGTEYKIFIVDEDDYRFNKEADAWCDPQAKEILLFNFKQSVDSVKDLIAYQKKVLRHEIVHAFLYESGLWQNSYGSKCWAQNEEMVDWIAIQEPKIHKAYEEAECCG